MPFQALSKGEGVHHTVITDRVRVDHLGLDVEVGVQAKQRIIDHKAMGAYRIRRRPDGVELLDAPIQSGLDDGLCGNLPGGEPKHTNRKQACRHHHKRLTRFLIHFVPPFTKKNAFFHETIIGAVQMAVKKNAQPEVRHVLK